VDWDIPQTGGLALAVALREAAYGAEHTIVLMVPTAGRVPYEEAAKEAGFEFVVTKPLLPSALMDIINTCVNVNRDMLEERPDLNGMFAGHCILLAEDVEINREIVLALLEPTMLEIDCAENGAEAVRMFSQAPEKYGMIFMDVQMPEMDGYEATRRIRALDNLKAKTIPIIAMTANVFREDIEKCIEAGMNSHLGKPLDFEEVFRRLREHLPTRRRAERRKRERRQGERRKNPGRLRTPERRISERRQGDRRQGDRRQSERRQGAQREGEPQGEQ
jgi:CheY-like chemotaxis protein